MIAPAARTLEPGLNLGTLRELPTSSALSALDDEARYSAIRDAGYVLVQDGDDEFARRAGLRSIGMGRVDEVGDAERIAQDAVGRGHECVTLHVGTGFETDSEGDALVHDILSASRRIGIPLYIETHRATITQDPWRTLQLVARFPGLRFNGDFSHWYTGAELVYGDLAAKLDALEPVFQRVRILHGRIGSPGCIQVDVEDEAYADAVGHFHEMWARSFAGYLADPEAGSGIAFLPELLPPSIFYAPTVRRDDGRSVEEGDRWVQARSLVGVASSAFAEARRRRGVPSQRG